MNLELKRKKFLVTGSSRGIGKAIAAGLLSEGAQVACLARGSKELQKVSREMAQRAGDDQVLSFAADCREESALKEVQAKLSEIWGGLDGVIANVGDGRSVSDPIPDSVHWNQIWQENFVVALNTARVFMPSLQQGKGTLLFISSIAGLASTGAPIDYSTAKTALIAFAQNLAQKVGPDVRVNVIAPGNVNFPGGTWEKIKQTNPERVERMLKDQVPLQRFAAPEEIADAAVFLCSARASFITSSVLRVDGGQISSIL